MTAGSTDFICPKCRGRIEATDGGYSCAACAKTYPILFDIPDFRLQSDQYLSLEDERAKAGKLHAYAKDHDFAALVSFYYSITDDVPDELAPTFARYVLNAPKRSKPALEALAAQGGRSLLDLGCGSGGALVAARDKFGQRTGVDIALRWLVIAQKRLDELGVEATLVCADAEMLPFSLGSFSHVLASDLLENTRSPAATLKSAGSILEKGGRLYVSASNSRWVGPHPATGVWAAGLLPTQFRKAKLERKHGVDILRAVSFVSPGCVRRMAADAGFMQIDVRPLQPAMSELEVRSAPFSLATRIYSALAKAALFRTLLVVAGPIFQSLFVKEAAK